MMTIVTPMSRRAARLASSGNPGMSSYRRLWTAGRMLVNPITVFCQCAVECRRELTWKRSKGP